MEDPEIHFRKLLNSELGRPDVDEYKLQPKAPVVVILDNIRSLHNVGSAFRTSDAFRIARICLCGICGAPPSPDIHKSALGAEFSVDWKYFKETSEAVRLLKSEGYKIISVEQTENSTSLKDFIPSKEEKYAIIFGNEVKGVQQEVVDMSDICLEIPQYGTKHSLNVSVAVGIVLWEITNHQ